MLRHAGLRFLLPYMQPYHRLLVIGTFYAFIGAAASAYSPVLLGMAVDELTAGVRPRVLAFYALGLIGLAAMLALFRYLLRMLTGTIAAGVSYRMSQDLFERVLLFDEGTLRQYGTGDLLSRATSDFIYIWRFYSAGFQMSMHALLLLAIGCALMAMTSPLLSFLVIGMLTLSIIAQVWLGQVLETAFSRVQHEMGRMSAFAQEHLSGARMLAAYGQEPQVVAAFKRSNDSYADRFMHFMVRSAVISNLPVFIVRLAMALVLGVGGIFVIEGQITVGQYVQFIVYLGLLAVAAQQLSQAFERLQQGSAAAGRIGEILRRRPQIVDAADAISLPGHGELRFVNSGVRVEGRWILRNIDLVVPPGTTVGIVGATGAGKSTLLSLIGRVRDPDEGCVQLAGHDLRHLKLAGLRRAVTYVFQETLLFGMSLRNNITLGLDNVPDERVVAAVHAARLSNDLVQLPQGLDTLVGERGASLSGGQKQRTAIARALVRDPHILILDDALASVDAHTAAEIIGELAAARAGRTTIIVSQRLAAVRSADQIILLDNGQIIERGTHQSLLEQNGPYAAMYRRELRQAEEDDSA